MPDPPSPAPALRLGPRLAGIRDHLADPGYERLRAATVSMTAALASFGTALFIEHVAHLSASVLVLAVALALSMGRVSNSRPEHRTGVSRLLAVVVLPLVAVGANEIGTRMLAHPDVGDTLFVLAVSATIYLRRFGALVTRLATVATLPLISMLIVPVPIVTTPGAAGDQRWWSALIALVAMVWVTVLTCASGAPGCAALPSSLIRLRRNAPQYSTARRPFGAGERRPSRHRIPASTRMAVQMGVALAAAFAVGRWLFPDHWTWVVLTAFIVGSGNRGRGDVAAKAVSRLLGASVGTLAATALSGVFPAGDVWSVVAIFAVLSVALWLRPLSYAYWAAGMTAALALLYGYYGERGPGLLASRLEAIVIGALLGVAASWFLLPVRTTDVIRRDAARALAALADYLAAVATGTTVGDPAGGEPDVLAGHQARFTEAVAGLDRVGRTVRMLRLVPRRLRPGPDYWPAIRALRLSAAALPAVTERLRSDRHPAQNEPAAALVRDIARLRRGIRDNTQPDPAAWTRLPDAIALLPAIPEDPAPSDTPAPVGSA